MTVHVLLADPPRPGAALPALPETSPLDAAEAADLASAMIADAVAAVAGSGGDLLVNYPSTVDVDRDPRAEFRALVADVLDDPDAVRYEVQIGSSFAARAGNAATYLLREEEAGSVAILDGRAPTLGRVALDGAAMKLRRNEVVLGPAPGGRVAYLGLSAPIDFDGAYEPPAVETLATRDAGAGHSVDFLAMHPRIETGADLATLLATVRAREGAGRRVPEHTAATLSSLGLGLESGDGGIEVVR